MTLSDIFRKLNPPEVPPRVPVREVGQQKPQEMKKEGNQKKITNPESKIPALYEGRLKSFRNDNENNIKLFQVIFYFST